MTALLAASLAGLLAIAPRQDSVSTLVVSTGVTPRTVTVGEPFRSHLRITLPGGARLRLGAFPANDALAIVDTVYVRRAGGAGDSTFAAVYPLVAWAAGDALSQGVPLTLFLASGDSTLYRVPLRLPQVRSVLPADTGELRPRPAKGLMLVPAPPARWWWLLLVPAALAAALLGWRSMRRAPTLPRQDPRAEALARLDRLGESSAAKPFYTAATRVLRQYLARLDERWGEDLTSDELLGRVGAAGEVDRAGLAALLRRADPVKFGALVPEPGETGRFAAEVRGWIVANPREAGARTEAA